MEYNSNSLPATPVLTARNNSYTNLRKSLDSSIYSNNNNNSNSNNSSNNIIMSQSISGINTNNNNSTTTTIIQSNISIPPTAIGSSSSNTTSTAPISSNSYLDNIRKGGFNNHYHVDESDYHNSNINNNSSSNQAVLTSTAGGANTTIINDGASMVIVENSNLLNFDSLPDDTFSEEDGLENINPKLISSLAYFTWLAASIILIFEKRNVLIQFHAYQSFIISMTAIGLQFLFIWTKTISIIIWSVYLLFVLFMIFKVNYDGGKTYKLPVIGEIAEKQAIKRSMEYSMFLKYVETSFNNGSNGSSGNGSNNRNISYSNSSVNTNTTSISIGSSVSTSTKSTTPLSDHHHDGTLNSSYDDISIIVN